MDLKAIIRDYIREQQNNITRRLLNTFLKHEGDAKELMQVNTLTFLEELTTAIETVMDKHQINGKEASKILVHLALAVTHED